jgi:membrane-bound metal-dependent hydrolase YbcI (DUF457 family)
MREAYETGEPRRLVAHTVRVGHDLWRRYTLRFSPSSGTVSVRIGPLVNTGHVTYPGTAPPDARWITRTVPVPFSHSYSSEYHIDSFSGPCFRFTRQDDKLVVDFLDWHHRWTHSLPMALLAGVVLGALCTLVWGATTGLWCGLLATLGYGVHILEDQLGHMGSNLFWPLTRRRIRGLGLLHATDAIPNFLVVWTCLVLILLNLDRFGGAAILPIPAYLGVGLGLPWLVLGIVHLRRRLGRQPDNPEALAKVERLAEFEGFDIE